MVSLKLVELWLRYPQTYTRAIMLPQCSELEDRTQKGKPMVSYPTIVRPIVRDGETLSPRR